MFGASGLNGGKGGLNQVGLQLAWRSRRSKSGRILVKVKEDWIRCVVKTNLGGLDKVDCR